MYTDPSQIRGHVIKLSLNDSEAALIDALVNITGQQKAVLLREILLDQAKQTLGVGMNFQALAFALEGQAKALPGN